MTTLMEMCTETIAQKEKEIIELKSEIEKECQEHREAMLVADNTIKTLKETLIKTQVGYEDLQTKYRNALKALELACETLKPKIEFLTDETYTIIPPSEYVKYFKQQAEKEVRDE